MHKKANLKLTPVFYGGSELLRGKKLTSKQQTFANLGNYSHNKNLRNLQNWKSDGRYICHCNSCERTANYPTIALRIMPVGASEKFMKIVILPGNDCECSGGWADAFEDLYPEEDGTSKQPETVAN